jgi:hypothetical protein
MVEQGTHKPLVASSNLALAIVERPSHDPRGGFAVGRADDGPWTTDHRTLTLRAPNTFKRTARHRPSAVCRHLTATILQEPRYAL